MTGPGNRQVGNSRISGVCNAVWMEGNHFPRCLSPGPVLWTLPGLPGDGQQRPDMTFSSGA
jgi:hypothetical protein